MNNKIHYKFRYRTSVLAIASCLSLAPLMAEAAGMGKITVFSGLGQPLRAEVDVTGTADELASMAARLAPQESFDQAGIYYGAALKDLRFALEKKGAGQGVIKITSNRPVNDPFLDFLIELNWTSGRLVREYTFLLDPLEVSSKSTSRPVAVVDAKPVAQLSGGSDRPADPRPGAAVTPAPAALAAPVATVGKPDPLPAGKPVAIPTSRPMIRVPTEPGGEPPSAPKALSKVEEPIVAPTPKAAEVRQPVAATTLAPVPAAVPTATATTSGGETLLWPPAPGKRLSGLPGSSAPAATPLPTSASTVAPQTPLPVAPLASTASTPSADSRSEVRLWPPEDKKRQVTVPAPLSTSGKTPESKPLEPLPAAKPTAIATTAPTTSAGTYEVQRGDTLKKIAENNLPEGVSLEQMLVGLYRSNNDAFMGNNINRLRTGAVLSIPSKDTAAAIAPDEARRVYRAQVSQWQAYRQKLAGVASDNHKEDANSQSSGGSVTAKVEEKAAPEAPKDQVKVSRTDGTGKGGKDAAKTAALEEELVTKNKAIKEGQDRIAALEKNVGELQKLLEMKNQALTDLQKQQAAKAAEPPPAPPKPAEPPKAEPAKPAEPPKAEEPKPVEPPKAEEPPKPAESAPVPAEPPPAPPPAPKPPPPPPEPEPEEEAGLLDGIIASVSEDPLPLAAGGGVLAALLGFMAYRRRRQVADDAPLSEAPSSYMASTLGPNSVYHSTGGQSINTSQTPPPLTDFSQAGPGTIDTDEVDPVAEADVYMAYGRDAQAEEILVEALQKDPQRTAVHLKLLEIYNNRRDTKQFETVASELYAQTGGKGPDWEKAAAMGAALDPANPLYGGRAAPPQPAPVTPPPPPPPVFEAPRPSVAPPPPPPPATNSMSLDFDLGATSLNPPAVEPPPPPPPPPPAPKPKPDFATTTLTGAVSLRFTQPTSTPPAQAAATVENSFTPEGTLIQSREAPKAETLGNDLDFDFGSASSLGMEAPPPPADGEAFDFDLKLTESALRGQEMPPNTFDMSSISLDLDAPGVSDAATEHGPQWEEVNTKLDLAKAYEEMGDLEGARELLQEVLNEGEADQISQAQGIMDRLANS